MVLHQKFENSFEKSRMLTINLFYLFKHVDTVGSNTKCHCDMLHSVKYSSWNNRQDNIHITRSQFSKSNSNFNSDIAPGNRRGEQMGKIFFMLEKTDKLFTMNFRIVGRHKSTGNMAVVVMVTVMLDDVPARFGPLKSQRSIWIREFCGCNRIHAVCYFEIDTQPAQRKRSKPLIQHRVALRV